MQMDGARDMYLAFRAMIKPEGLTRSPRYSSAERTSNRRRPG
jgi:hypothetical protein